MSRKKKVSYRSGWQVEFPWIKKDEKDDQAFCNVCKISFRIDNSGLSQVKAHASSNNHVSKEKLLSGKTNQRVFVSALDKQMTLSSSSFVLSTNDQVTNSEIVKALDCVDLNFSFASTNNDGKKFQRMFPDSKIAES